MSVLGPDEHRHSLMLDRMVYVDNDTIALYYKCTRCTLMRLHQEFVGEKVL